MFLPQRYQEMISTSGSNFLVAIVALEIVAALTPLSRLTGRMVGRKAVVDHWNHLGGLAAGSMVGWYWSQKREREKRKQGGIWERYFGAS